MTAPRFTAAELAAAAEVANKHRAVIRLERNGNGEALVGPEGLRKAPGTGLISLDMAAPWGAEIGPNGFNRLAGKCPTPGNFGTGER